MADAAPSQPAAPHRRPDWGRRVLTGAIALVAAVLIALAASAVIPRWWAHRVGDQVGGSTLAGMLLGVIYGLVFTLLPILVLWWTFRRRRPWKVWVAGVVVAAIVAAPNLMTLAVVLGTGNAAHAGQRTLDVDAPFFRGFAALGAGLAALLFVVWRYQMLTRSRAKRRTRRLEEELAQSRRPAEEPKGEG